MALRLLLNTYDVPQYDYGRNFTFHIYDETQTAFDATAYTSAVFKTFDSDGNQMIPDIPVTWTSQSTGVGTVAYTISNRPAQSVFYYVCVQMWNSTVRVSTARLRIFIDGQPSTN